MPFAGRRTITVLLVDDASDVRELLAALLEIHGFTVVTAGSAAEALTAARRVAEIDLLLADLRLPDGDGTEVARNVVRIHPGLRSLFISGSAAPPLADGQAYLRKPARVAAILNEIRALLPQSAYGRAS